MTLKDYSHQNLAGADFSGVDLTEADLSYANLEGANFAVALLQDANLAFANMKGVNLGETLAIKIVAISLDGQLLASASKTDNLIRIWDTASRRELHVLEGHTDDINALVFSPAGRWLASGSDDRTIRLWDVETWQTEQVLEGHDSPVRCLAFSPDGELLASGDGRWGEQAATIRLWDVSSSRQLAMASGHKGRVLSLAFSPDGSVLASGGSDRIVQLWNLPELTTRKEITEISKEVRSLIFDESGGLLFVLSADLEIVDVVTGAIKGGLPGHTDYVRSVAFSPDGRLLASGSEDKSVRLWEVESGRLVQTLEGHERYVTSVAFSPDGRLLASGSKDKSVRLWEVESGRLVRKTAGRSGPTAIALLDAKQIAVADKKGAVEIWRLPDLQRRITVKLHKGTINCLAFSVRTNLLASGSEDKSLGLLDIKTGQHHLIRQELHCLRANIFGVRGLRPDQRALMLRKGAVEIDPRELPGGWSPKSNREAIRSLRLRNLAREIGSERREKHRPVVLIIGPGTFLPRPEEWDRGDYEWLVRFLPMPPRMLDRDPSETQRAFEYLYKRLLTDPYYFEKRFLERPPKPLGFRSRDVYRGPALHENYEALVELVNERVFNIVLDMDIFSQLDREMFPLSRRLEGKYAEYEDLEYALSRLVRDWRYVEKGESLFFKFFSADWLRSAGERQRDRFRLLMMFDELFKRIVYKFEGRATIIWTGFHIQEIIHSLRRFESGEWNQRFYWVIDESIRETREGQIQANYLDYKLGHFSDVFRDLYVELKAVEQERPGVGLHQLRHWVFNGNEEQRIRAAEELVDKLASGASLSPATLIELINALSRDYIAKVRRAVVQSMLKNYTRLPSELTNLIPQFANDPEEAIRADIARWILVEYQTVGAIYNELLQALAQDRSPFVRQAIVDTVTARFEQLPAPVRLLASQIVGAQIEVQLIKGGGMLVGEASDLVLRLTNYNEAPLDRLEVEIIEPSAEYEVLSANLQVAENVASGQTIEFRFQLKTRVARQIAVNYRVNGELKEPPLYINAIQDNPYIYGDPIKGDLMFFGRNAELEEIIQAITKPAKQDILVVGERRTGKTSLLYQLQRRLERPFIPVFAELYVCRPTTENILQFIVHKIVATLVEQNLLSPEWRKHRFTSIYFQDQVKEVLSVARNNLADIKIVLLIDEADYLPKVRRPGFAGWIDVLLGRPHIDERVQNILRSTLQSDVGTDLRAVVAGTSDLFYYVSQRSSPFFNHFRFVRLKPLTSDQTRELITKPAALLGYSYTTSAIEKIMKLSGGQPFYCQALCYEAFASAIAKMHYRINLEDVNIAEEKRVEDLFPSFRSYFWNKTNKLERKFLSALATGAPVEQFSDAQIQRLLDWGIVVRLTEDQFAFSCGLIEKWTKMAL